MSKSHISPSIIMRIKEFGESDLLVTFFTEDLGQMKGVAKGARRSCRRFVNCLDLFSLVNLEFEHKGEGKLPFIHCGKLIDAFEGLRRDFSALSLASYMIELTETLFPVEVADRNMFHLLRDAFGSLAGRRGVGAALAVFFELKAMGLGGYGINTEQCCICGRTYKGEGTAVFVREKGGIACLGCRQASKGAPALGPETVKEIRRMLAQSAPLLNAPTVSEETLLEIKPILKLHREYCLGRNLKTARFLE